VSEFWLVCGCWHGKVMMWTNPNEDNNFTITAKCRIGHKDDVLAIDSSQQYIVSGGVDGLVSIWNLFSGILKFAIALPPPSQVNPDSGIASSPTLYDKE
jgi:WD40 repeat protein